MAAATRMMETQKIVQISAPKSYSGIASTTQYLSMKNYQHVAWIINTGLWPAGTAAVTLAQATTVSGTSTKALAFSWMWVNTAALIDTFTKTAVTSNTFNLDTAGLTYVVEVDASDCDVTGGFDCVALLVASPGANADLYNIVAVLGNTSTSRYPGATLPTAILN
jgi:hypothetical protein